MKRIVRTLVFVLVICIFLQCSACATNNSEKQHTKAEIEVDNYEKEKETIGKYLFNNARSDYTSGVSVLSGGKVLTYESTPKDVIEVRYDPDSHKYAAIVEVRWSWNAWGSVKWHYEHTGYTGTYEDGKVSIEVKDRFDKTGTSQSAFWDKYWKTEVPTTK